MNPGGVMRKILVWAVDRLIIWREWWRSRRDTIASLTHRLEQQRTQYEAELEKLRSEIKLRDLEILQLAAVNRRDLERVEREIAIAVAGRAAANLEAASPRRS